jgi:ABC-type antimicrobial peptide transport system permease subunit
MKKALLSFPILLILFGFIFTKIVDDKLQKLLKQFNSSEESAQASILSNITGPSYYIPNLKFLKNMAFSERTEMVSTLGNYIKEYIKSDDFVKKYNQYREGQKPSEPEQPKYSAQLKKEMKEGLNKNITELESTLKTVPADQKSMYNDILKQIKQQLKDVDDPVNSPYKPEMDEYIKQGYDQEIESYKTELSKWEKEYPINNPKPLIKNWINVFLDNSNNIDFNAKLKTVKDKQVFVNPEYERKDYYWKFYFRSGKEPVEAARKFAQAWLTELK